MSSADPPKANSDPADAEQFPLQGDRSATAHDAVSAPSRQSHIISSVLSPAVRLWVRSQLERADDLQLKIESSDRQVLSGCIRRVSVSARNAVYRGIHLTQADVVGEGIRTNLRQVLRGKALRLLEAFPIAGEVHLREDDLNASLQNPLLGDAVINFLIGLLKSELAGPDDEEIKLTQPQVVLSAGQITLTASLDSASGNPTPVVVRTGLRIENGSELKLDRPQWLPHPTAQKGLFLNDLDGFTVDLGPHVRLQELTLAAGQLTCRGQIMVTPEEG